MWRIRRRSVSPLTETSSWFYIHKFLDSFGSSSEVEAHDEKTSDSTNVPITRGLPETTHRSMAPQCGLRKTQLCSLSIHLKRERAGYLPTEHLSWHRLNLAGRSKRRLPRRSPLASPTGPPTVGLTKGFDTPTSRAADLEKPATQLPLPATRALHYHLRT